jgi:hypothetical protein
MVAPGSDARGTVFRGALQDRNEDAGGAGGDVAEPPVRLSNA